MTMKRRTFAIILLVDALAALFAVWYLFLRPADADGQTYYVRVYVAHSDGGERGFSFSTSAGTLDRALADAEEEIAGLDSSGGETVILSADGETAPDGKCWRVEIDGQLREEGLEQIAVLNREKYRLVLTDACD